MSVYVVMTVRPPDPGTFEAAMKAVFADDLPSGALNRFWGRDEEDPSRYIIAGAWESHDAMHAYTDRVGEQFNREAGTEGVEWETSVWEIAGSSN